VNNRVHIAALRNRYLVPADHPAPDDVRSRLDDTARSQLRDACATVFDRILDPRDRSVWLIRRLELDLAVDAGIAAPDHLARFWGQHIAAKLARTIARGPDGDSVLRFDDEDDYYAHFIADVASATAWRCWQYRRFDSLRSLPAGAAIREALFRDPAHAAGILQRVAKIGRLDSVLHVISEYDARQIGRVLPTDAAEGSLREELEMVVTLRRPVAVQPTPHEALRIAVELHYRIGFSRVELILRCIRLLENAPEPLLASITGGHLAIALGVARETGFTDDIDAIMALLDASVHDAEWLAATIRQLQLSPANAATTRKTVLTSFGAVFLLLPAMLEVAPPEVLDSPALRLLLAAESLTHTSDPEFFLDDAVLLAAGLSSAPDLAEIGNLAAMREDLTSLAQLVLHSFTSRLIGFRHSAPEFLWANLFAGQSGVSLREDRIDVQLPPVPLRVILRFAGVHGQTYTVPWLPGRTIHLWLPEE